MITRLLTTTAIGLIATGLAMPAHAQTTETAEIGGPCQQQWTAVDENQDGQISDSEAQAAAEAEFSRIDMDGNGTITVAEWKDCAAPGAIPGGFAASTESETGTAERAIGEASAPETADTGEQTTADADSEGQTSDTTAAANGAAEAWGSEFSQMDTDDSGDISAEEAAEWSRSQAADEQATDEEAVRAQAARFAMLDSDGDGKVTQQEWQEQNLTEVEARFAIIDENGDGQVSKSEWQQHRQERFEQAQAAAHEQVDLWLFYYNLI